MTNIPHQIWVLLPCVLTVFSPSVAISQNLDSFAVLAGSTVTNTGSSIINGNIGVSPGTAVTGFPPGIVLPPFATYSTGAVPANAQIELGIDFTTYDNTAVTTDLSGQNLGGLELIAGVYGFDSSAGLTGTLTLDAQGDPNAIFIINVGSTLTTASNSAVALINGAQGRNVFFVVGSSATLGTGTDFAGQILALTSITLNTGADIACGSAWARNGAVTLDTNRISICALGSAEFGDLIGPGATPEQEAIAAALDAFVASGGTLPRGFQELLAFLSPEEITAALAELSGELGTAVAPAGILAMNSFFSNVFNRLDDRTPPVAPPQDNTVRALGYAPTPSSPALAAATDVFAAGWSDPRLWNVWGSVYGDRVETTGDSSADRTVEAFGIAAGIDYRVSADTVLGFALAGGGTDFELDDGFGAGSSELIQLALYSRTYFDAAYVATAVGYGWSDVSTERTVTANGADTFQSSFAAHNFAGQIEVGYRFDFHGLTGPETASWATPYGSAQVQLFHTPSYSEEVVSGSPDFALRYDDNDTLFVQTELGFRFGHVIPLDDMTLVLRSKIAWSHSEASGEGLDAGFQSIPGSAFEVNGAELGGDALLLSVGAEVELGSGASVLGLFDTRLSEDSTGYSGSAKLRYAF